MVYNFGKASLRSRAQLHPKLRAIVDEVILEVDFRILDAVRGRIAQEKAFAQGFSKVHFGNSAHNYVPAVAMDLFPAPYDWNNKKAFITLSKVVFKVADKHKTAIRWLGDPNRDGNLGDGWDFPHFELHPWRDWAKKSKLYEED